MSDLRAIAESARIVFGYEAGWFKDRDLRNFVDDDDIEAFEQQERAHIAAWSPDRALAALDVIEAARADHLDRHGGSVSDAAACAGPACDRLRDVLDRWEALG